MLFHVDVWLCMQRPPTDQLHRRWAILADTPGEAEVIAALCATVVERAVMPTRTQIVHWEE